MICKRNSTTSLFSVLDTAISTVIGTCRRYRFGELLDFLKTDRRVRDDLDIHIIMDVVKAWLARRPHWQVRSRRHPRHGSIRSRAGTPSWTLPRSRLSVL